ncbi:MAG: DUF4244 domain-containing protein [Acidimicrobiia bacterium]
MSFQTVNSSTTTKYGLGLRALVAMQSAAMVTLGRLERNDRGQSTAEYALVILGAAGVALLLVAWTSKTNKIGKLLDTVLDSVLSRFS